MDIKTVYGFILIGAGFLFQALAHTWGIDGTIETTVASVIAIGLFLIGGKDALNKSKGGVK